MQWTWDDEKDARNRAKHGLGFETATRVFEDPFALSIEDPHPDGDRWRTVGQVAGRWILVVHTGPEVDNDGKEIGRIISARKATPRERKAYESLPR